MAEDHALVVVMDKALVSRRAAAEGLRMEHMMVEDKHLKLILHPMLIEDKFLP